MSNRSDIPREAEAFDFRLIKNSQFKGEQYEGVVMYADGNCQFLTRTTTQTDQNSPCSCKFSGKNQCAHCTLFQSKLRNGLFYCGDYLVCRQDKNGNVFIQKYKPNGELENERLLFTNFKKINAVVNAVVMVGSGITQFITEGTSLIYDYKFHKKYVIQEDLLTLKEFYEEKFPWMHKKQLSRINAPFQIIDGDMVFQEKALPIYIALFERIIFSKILFVCDDLKLIFLKTNQDKVIEWWFDEGLIYEVKEPPYDSVNVTSWLDLKICDAIKRTLISQSFMGKYVGHYLLIVWRFFVNLKNRLLFLKFCFVNRLYPTEGS